LPPIVIGGRRGATLELVSPVMIAAGCFGRGASAAQRAWLRGVGALVTHTITPEPRGRGALPAVAEAAGGVLYASGLPNRGFERELAASAGSWAGLGLPVVVSIAADNPRSLAGMAADLDAISGVAAIEVTPYPAPAGAAGSLAEGAAAVAAVAALPLLVKLPALPDARAEAFAALDAGADAIVAAHGWPARRAGQPHEQLLLAGPATLPLTLRLVMELAGAGVAPLIACGGVDAVAAARAYFAAGACAVQAGSALFRDPTLAAQIAADLAGEASNLDPGRSRG